MGGVPLFKFSYMGICPITILLTREIMTQTKQTRYEIPEVENCPKMLEVYLEQAWQTSFCFGFACEDVNNKDNSSKILLAIIAGNDSTLQATKAAMDIGSSGFRFGHGKKTLSNYEFESEFRAFAEKGCYERFPITINQNRKAMVIVHEKLLSNEEYVLSFDGDPAQDIATLLGGGKYGLHILNDWKTIVYTELMSRNHIEEVDLYYDKNLFPKGLSLLKINLEEEQADEIISELIKTGQLKFPSEGTGDDLKDVDSLADYMMAYSNAMIEQLTKEVTPTHDPIKDKPLDYFDSYSRTLFPVQSHVATAIAKRFLKQKAVIIQGEMSTGKSSIMTAVADGYHHLRGKKGYFACLMCPPSLTSKWPDEIRALIPDAIVHVIKSANQLIEWHQSWINSGRKKPVKPTFFIISFTTMRNDARNEPAVTFKYIKTSDQTENKSLPYRYGYYCPCCGNAHQVVESKTTVMNEQGIEEEKLVKRSMNEDEFGTGRRFKSSTLPQNAFCSECGESLWTKRVPTRYSSFKEWAKHENKILHAIKQNNQRLINQIQSTQQEYPKATGMPRRIAAIEYIRRKMKNFFDFSIVDEIHETKGGNTAQGNALGSLAAVSRKILGGTGTLFGGKAEDVYYLLWRLFPSSMVKSGFQYSEVRRFNEEYGNIEETVYQRDESSVNTNTNSRGGIKKTEKVLPGISSFIYGRYMIQNVVNVRLKEVWPDPVELIDTPTIFVEMDEELSANYKRMIATFEREIDTRDDGHKLYLPMTDYGISYVDQPFTFPDATMKNNVGGRDLIWSATHLKEENRLLPKEKKLQEIVETELSQGRKSIVYVRDTGSSQPGRDVRPRLKKVLEQIGAKVCILDTTTTKTDQRSQWLKKKIEAEGYDVCIVSQELVKVGLDRATRSC